MIRCISPDRIEVQFVRPVAICGQCGDSGSTAASSVQTLSPAWSAAPSAVLPARQRLQFGNVIGVHDDCVADARRDDESVLSSHEFAPRVLGNWIFLIFLDYKGRSPRLQFNRVVAAR